MVNYAVNDYATPIGSLDSVLAALETKLETIDNAKTIRLLEVKNVGADFRGILITDA